MDVIIVAIITAVASVVASSGFWSYWTKKHEKDSASSKMLLGLAHDKIIELGMKYIERGSISHDELENLIDYLYVPYKDLGGNGAAKRVVDIVKTLPVTNTIPTWPEIERRRSCSRCRESQKEDTT